jgi:DNA-binding beta-propeller fold protein YncE/mono/diheme cytochrome c family protein
MLLNCWKRYAILVTVLATGTVMAEQPLHEKACFRRPVAVVESDQRDQVLVANRLSGTISQLDLSAAQVLREVPVGQQLSAMVRLPGSSALAITDEKQHQLILLDLESLDIVIRIPVSPYPVSVITDKTGSWCYVTSLWSRRLSVIRLDRDNLARSAVTQIVDMPFAPREQLLVRDDQNLIVADSFAARLAILDTGLPAGGTVTLNGMRRFPGHNIRGLGVSANGQMLLVAHQMLNELAHTVRNDVHWGLLMSNDLRWLRLDNILQGGADLYSGAHMHPLGEAGSATGDPSALQVAESGTVVVALGGVGEIALGKEDDFSLRRVKVGRRPTSLLIREAQNQVLVLNRLDDSVSVVDTELFEEQGRISLGPRGELTDEIRGERLFFDANVSHDGWMSCHSCHTDGHANGMLNDNFSDKSFGAPKRVLSLLGRSNTAPFAWNAGNPDLATQVRLSAENTMQSDEPLSDKQVSQLVAFLKTLAPPPPVDKLRGVADRGLIARGKQVFDANKCARCHAPPTYTTPQTYDVGLPDKQGNLRFNPPPLIGVGQRGPYLHDNSAKQLQDVFLAFGHPGEDANWDVETVRALVAFLRSL